MNVTKFIIAHIFVKFNNFTKQIRKSYSSDQNLQNDVCLALFGGAVKFRNRMCNNRYHEFHIILPKIAKF